jgi:hypothetical protein
MHVWSSDSPNATVEAACISVKVNFLMLFQKQSCMFFFFFAEATVTDVMYLDVLELWL